MNKFEPRTKKPNPGNKYYISSRGGGKGWNPCILGNNNTTYGRDKSLNVLPNCTGWVTGRYNEAIGERVCAYFGKGDAKDYYQVGQLQGLKVGKEPKPGAVIVWNDGKHGHVAVVEQVSKDGTKIRVSQSGWDYNGINHMWFADHFKGEDGNWIKGSDYNWMRGKYKFVGFVYYPEVEEDDMTEAEVIEIIKKYEESKKYLPADEYAKDALQWAKDEGIMKGDSSGNQMPQAYIKREDVAVMLYRMEEK